jgi:hypothetical protein
VVLLPLVVGRIFFNLARVPAGALKIIVSTRLLYYDTGSSSNTTEVVFRIVGRLNHRKEAKAMRNDLDLPLQPVSNCGQGEMGRMMESLPASSAEPEWKGEEDERKLDRLLAETRERLGADKRAKRSSSACAAG